MKFRKDDLLAGEKNHDGKTVAINNVYLVFIHIFTRYCHPRLTLSDFVRMQMSTQLNQTLNDLQTLQTASFPMQVFVMLNSAHV